MKTKLGISIGLLGAAVYFVALFNGYVALTLIAGYILLFEEDAWLKKSAVKAFVILTLATLFSALIGFIPDIINLIDHLIGIFNQNFSIRPISSLISFVDTAIIIARKVLLLLLGLQALTRNSTPIGPIDKIVDEHMKAE